MHAHTESQNKYSTLSPTLYAVLHQILQYSLKSCEACRGVKARGLCGGVDEAEDVVEDVPVLTLLLELERLGEGHGLL
jgi:hypothetical protein